MNKDNLIGGNEKKKNDGIIVTCLSTLAVLLSRLFSHSIFKKIFCSYSRLDEKAKNGFLSDSVKKLFHSDGFDSARARIKHFAEKNALKQAVDTQIKRLLARDSRDYGIYFAMTGVYIIFVYALKSVMFDTLLPDNSSLFAAAVLILLAVLTFRPHRSLATVLCGNKLLRFITLELVGIKPYEFGDEGEVRSSAVLPLILGMITGVACFFVPATSILLVLLAVIAFVVLVKRTEAGVLLLLAFFPFMSDKLFVAVAFITAFSYIFKLICSKTYFRFTLCDAFVIMWGIVSAITPLFASSTDSNGTGRCAVLCMLLYFAAKNTVNSRDEILRCYMAQIAAMTAVCGFGVLSGLMNGMLFTENSVFPSEVRSTFLSKQALAVYIVSVLPYVLVTFMYNRGKKSRRIEFGIVILLALFVLLTLNSLAALVAFAVVLLALMLTHGKRSFCSIAVLILPIALVASYVPLEAWEKMYAETSVSLGENLFTKLYSDYGFTSLFMFVVACMLFFGKMLSYVSENYGGFVKKSMLSRFVHAPYLSILAVLVYGMLETGFDISAFMCVLFIHGALGDSVIANAMKTETDEYEYYIGGIGL